MKTSNVVKLPNSHIYRDSDTNTMRDSHIEHMFDDFLSGNIEDTTKFNFIAYASVMVPDDIYVEPSRDIFDNEAAAVAWVSRYLTFSVTPIPAEDLPLVDPSLQPFASTVRVLSDTDTLGTILVVAKNAHLGVLLLFTEVMRRMSLAVLNKPKNQPLH